MKVLYNLNDFPSDVRTVVSIGTFDGVHKGHQLILQELKKQTDAQQKSVVFTFWPHPKKILSAGKVPPLLSTLEERLALIEKEGIDYTVVVPFTKELAALSARAFVEEVLVKKLHLSKIIIGYDHRFGNDRTGDLAFLQRVAGEFHFDVQEIPAQYIEQTAVSSTKIRAALEQHQCAEATKHLGHYYSISGEVVKGKQLGRTLGYPTANLHVEHTDKLIPSDGIYAVWAEGSFGIRPAMMSIGNNPTIEGATHSIEVHIFNLDADLYSQQVRVYFVEYMRAELKFSGLEALTDQLKKDELHAKEILTHHPQP
ncbi:MAG TPA: bifunctional riboflavin kinase/FAD synthetase [Cytophagaceae bacterium]|nr:bifunctional riboflavin kinase/FAD synthetase [Cytophagaceae bacterium]